MISGVLLDMTLVVYFHAHTYVRYYLNVQCWVTSMFGKEVPQ